ncbi:MAG: hypothetical protein AABY22_04370 [Nanoarchaeota archaeon]
MKTNIKDLELQIDHLCGYAPQGLHWKQEYHVRKTLIDDTLNNAPLEIVNKIQRLQNSIYEIQNETQHDQKYLKQSLKDYTKKHEVKVNQFGKLIGTFMINDIV